MNATLYDPSDVAFGAQPRLVCAGCGQIEVGAYRTWVEGVGLNELLGGEPTGEDMDKDRIRDEAEAFFEWPTHDKTHVTTTSMLIFAGVIAGMAAEEAARAEKAWRKDAEAVLEKMAGEGWITEALQAEGVSGICKALLSLKREARGVLSPPNAD